jgi:hypothetical protein
MGSSRSTNAKFEDIARVTTSLEREGGRSLGALETLLWLANQKSPKQFVVAAEIEGQASDLAWQSAITEAQARHPLLRAGITCPDGRAPAFRLCPNPIPFKTIHEPREDRIARYIEDELATPFVEGEAPLIRCSLLQHGRSATLVITTHHAIGDGLSVVYLIRDILRALAGERLAALPLPPSQEDLLQASPLAEAPPSPFRRPRVGTIERRHRGDLRVETRVLPADLGAELRDQARANGSSVHGALVAAIVIEGAARAPHLADAPVNLMSPVNARAFLDRGEAFAISFATATGDIDAMTSGGFWAVARRANAISEPLRSAEGLAVFAGALKGFIQTGPGVDDALELERHVFPIDFMISNLGVLPFPAQFGPFEIRSLFGPSMILGMEGERMIGIANVGSKIHLTQSSYSPIESLLEGVEARLRSVVGWHL